MFFVCKIDTCHREFSSIFNVVSNVLILDKSTQVNSLQTAFSILRRYKIDNTKSNNITDHGRRKCDAEIMVRAITRVTHTTIGANYP